MRQDDDEYPIDWFKIAVWVGLTILSACVSLGTVYLLYLMIKEVVT